MTTRAPHTPAPEVTSTVDRAQELPAIELRGVAKAFASRHGDVPAVRQVDLQIQEGEFFSLLGPSGCGKTTTLRMIAGFEEPTQGQVMLYGRDVTGIPPNKRDVNLVFQSYALFPHMDVAANIAFGLKRKKVAGHEARDRVEQAVQLVQLQGKENRRPRELSGGQQQRVALARALVNRPRALLLDEPLGALDLKLRQSMQIELKRIQREVGITFIYVTHDQGEALTMSDRLVVMNNGRVEQLGTPPDVYERPSTRFVAGFIGTSNILTGTVARVVDGAAVIEFGPDERIVVPLRETRRNGDTIELTVRPEKVTMSTVEPRSECRLRGTVSETVYLGTSTNYTVATSTGDEIVVFCQNGAGNGVAVDRGAPVWLSWSAQHSYPLTGSAASASESPAAATVPPGSVPAVPQAPAHQAESS